MLTPHLISELVRPSVHADAKAEAVRGLEKVEAIGQAPVSVAVLHDGCYGLQRNGRVVGPIVALDPGGDYAYHVGGAGWTADGRYIAHSEASHPRDIIRIAG